MTYAEVAASLHVAEERGLGGRPYKPLPGVQLLGIAGKAGSGKTWLADKLKAFGFKPWCFAWPIKQNLLRDPDMNFEDVHYLKPPKVRRLLQLAGDVEKATYGDQVYLRQMVAWLRLLSSEHGVRRFAIPDVRFPNEAWLIRRMGGKLVRMQHGPGLPYHLLGSDEAEHPTETALDNWRDWDAVITNSPSAFTPAHIPVLLKSLNLEPGAMR